jgi:hypothetical protein
MFGFFGSKNPVDCPVNEEMRLWMENAMLWLAGSFGEDSLKKRQILTPEYNDFPIAYNGHPNSALATLKIIAGQMEISADDIQLDIYKEGLREVDTGGIGRIFMKEAENEKYSGGLYWGKQEDGKYHVGLNESKLKVPLEMIATLAHEFAHIKLLGEKRIEKNNEPLTDLATVVFGLGIFNANASFQIKNTFDTSGWSRLGYLSQMEWGYGLALFSCLREEEEKPAWIKYLSPNVKADFLQRKRFIEENEEIVFKGVRRE